MKLKNIIIAAAAATAAAVTVGALAFGAGAKSAAEVECGVKSYKRSDKAVVTVGCSFSGNASGAQADLNFDPEVFEYISADAKTPDGWYAEAELVKSGKLRILCYDDSRDMSAPLTGSAKLYSVTLKVKDSALSGTYNVTADNLILSDKNGRHLSKAESGSVGITVEPSAVKPPHKPKNGWVNGCYYKNDRLMKNCWVTAGAKKYRADINGRMVKNKVVKIGGKYYAFKKSGVLYKGGRIATVKGKKYYADKKGVIIASRWIKYRRKWYRAAKNGALVQNKRLKIGKKVYKFGKNCVCKNKR